MIGRGHGLGRRLAVALAWLPLIATAQPGAPELSNAIAQLLDADPMPHAVVDPNARFVLLVHERRLLPIERLARPALELAGRFVDPQTIGPHGQRDYYALTLVDVATGIEQPIPLPRDVVIGYPSWAPDGSRFAFTITSARGTELWIGHPEEARARPLVEALNAINGQPCTWAPDSRRMLCKVIGLSRSDAQPTRERLDRAVESELQRPRMGQPVPLDPRVAAMLLESQLMLIDSVSGQRHVIGPPAAYVSASLSPASAFILVTRVERPYPLLSGIDPAEQVVELWDRAGRRVMTLPPDARAVDWLPSQPATLVWVEQIEGRDHVLVLEPPFAAPATDRFVLPHRFAGRHWLGTTTQALIADHDATRRVTTLWHLDMLGKGAQPLLTDAGASARSVVTGLNAHGMAAASVDADGFYVRGVAPQDGQSIAFLDHVALDGSGSRRVWQQSKPEVGEQVVGLLAEDASHLLIREDNVGAPASYWIKRGDGRRLAELATSATEMPRLADARTIELEYARSDGWPLHASLYLPPGYDGAGPLPMIIWAYPRYVSTAELIASEGEDTPRDTPIPTFERAFRWFYLLHGFAVLDNVAMPVVGDITVANDTFVEQIVANAEAAIDAAAGTGAVDRARIGIAGHSYGAFMVANLLAHSDLFAAGAALSGAYNRTLTPFGFQTERRTLWQAPQTYIAMSPLLYSDRIAAPLLLVHGLNDDNAGTSPLQSTQFYEAIRRNNGEAELLLLPWEGHTYRARESVHRTAAEMLAWFDRYLKPSKAGS